MDHSILRRINIGVVNIAVSFLIFSTNIYAQHYREITLSNGQQVKIDNSKSGSYSFITKNGKIESVLQENPDEMVHLIVTFKDPPLAVYQTKKPSLQKYHLILCKLLENLLEINFIGMDCLCVVGENSTVLMVVVTDNPWSAVELPADL